MDTVTISRQEYDELLLIKQHAEERASIENKVGGAWQKYQWLIAFNTYLKDNLIGYGVKKKEFNLIWRRKGGYNNA